VDRDGDKAWWHGGDGDGGEGGQGSMHIPSLAQAPLLRHVTALNDPSVFAQAGGGVPCGNRIGAFQNTSPPPAGRSKSGVQKTPQKSPAGWTNWAGGLYIILTSHMVPHTRKRNQINCARIKPKVTFCGHRIFPTKNTIRRHWNFEW